jgi:hypothetical protein
MSVTGSLGYLFWHAPASGADPQDYEAALVTWQEALAAHPPPGFAQGWTWRVPTPPWLAGWPVSAYLDVYVVVDFAALGVLNAQAVSGFLQAAHDAAAVHAAHGSGALFACRSGVPGPQPEGVGTQAQLFWYDKPAGTTYPGMLGSLTGEGRAVWLRQMVFGAGPEFLVVGRPGEASSPASAWNAAAVVLCAPGST